MANYLGNSNTKELHQQTKVKPACNIPHAKAANWSTFSTKAEAKRAGYGPCKHCIGGTSL